MDHGQRDMRVRTPSPDTPRHQDELTAPPPEVLAAVAEHGTVPAALVDRDGVVRWVGASAERAFGWVPGSLVGRSVDEVVAPGSRAEVREALAGVEDAVAATPWGGVGLPIELLDGLGRPVACEVSLAVVARTGLPWHVARTGSPWYVVHVRRVGHERALDQAVAGMAAGAPAGQVLARLVAALEMMVPGSVAVLGGGWTGTSFAVTAGARAALLTGEPTTPWARALREGRSVAAGLDDMAGPVAARARAEGLDACWVLPVTVAGDEGPRAVVVVWRHRPEAPSQFTWTTVRRVGDLLRLALQWDRGRSSLEFAATHDALTGLANRQAFLDRLDAVAAGVAGAGQAAVLCLDLDHFKPVNEHLGHPVGDRVLAIVAARLREEVRPGDLVARMGGDEFAVLCERLASPEAVEAVAARLLEAVRRPVQPVAGSDDEVCLDASIGVADLAGGSVAAVLARADDAMRAAKVAGRGRWLRATA